LLLVRHGESQGNARRRFTDSEFDPLSPAGREQAERVAAFLRARFSPVLEPALREQFLGALHGQPYDAALKTPGYESLPRWEWRPPGGETLVEVQTRAVRALLAVARASIGKDVVVTSHAGTISSCWAHVEGSWLHVPPVPNCSVVLVEHDGAEFGEPELLLSSP
jgi:broad specificity phosphatase PhoE